MKPGKIVFGAFALVLFMTSCGNKQGSAEQAPAYPTMQMQEKTTELLSVYPATIRGREDVEIRPRIDGFIESIHVDEGTVVKKGQLLFKINSPQSEQDLTSAQAALTSAQAQVNTAKVNVNRIRPLTEKGIMGKVQLETVEDAYQSAMATLAQAEATLKNAQATMGWTNVISPVGGVVGPISYRLGSLVNSANVLTVVANTSNVYAYFSLNEKELTTFLNNLEGNTQAEKIKNAREVTLTLADGSIYLHKGRIETITGTVNITTGSANFRVEFPNNEGLLRSGTSGKVAIPRTLENIFVVPQKATFAQQDKVLIFAVQGDSVVQKVISVIPTPDGKSYAVTKGLDSGERVVTDGIATLYNGKKVRFE